MTNAARSEAEVLTEIAKLAQSPGYAHAIAQICFRDNLVAYSQEVKASDLTKLFGDERLIRTEINTLLGFMVQGSMDLTAPSIDELNRYVRRSDELMGELHEVLKRPMVESMLRTLQEGGTPEDVWKGEVLREPIFYGPESAYSFQYRDLIVEKYGSDDPWLVENRGFSSGDAQAVARGMCDLMDERATSVYAAGRGSQTAPERWLQAFEHSAEEIAYRTGIPLSRVQAVFAAFTLKDGNKRFRSLGDFNGVTATPLFQTNRGTVLLFQQYGIYEAIYDSPFYWMMADKAYANTASDHRGQFTEHFGARRLATVFGSQHIHRNVNIVRGKGNTVGEIDVLVVFGDRLIIVQAKSKKLTLDARRGNDGQLRKDFAAAIQDSYDQGWACAEAISTSDSQLVDGSGQEITLPGPPTQIFIFSLLSEHYPALAFQARQYLKYKTSEVIQPPFVMDVFLLDALTEMLSTPLRLLSYVQLRVGATEKVTLSHELTALGHHLRCNLWVGSEYSMLLLDDALAVDLDTAMTLRRQNVPGQRTPPGILTRLAGTHYERLIAQMEQRADAASLAIGLELLQMDEATCRRIHHGLEGITRLTSVDGQRHDFTLGGSTGICFHCNPTDTSDAREALARHCAARKYKAQASQWFGVSVDPLMRLQFGVSVNFAWEQSSEMDAIVGGMKNPVPAASLAQYARAARRTKLGKNHPCPCGSGKKYKRCCLLR